MKHGIRQWSLALMVLATAGTAQSGVVIQGTRVVYAGSEREVSVRMSNQRSHPVLVEAWMDDGEAQGTIAPPFALTPPLFRLDPGKGQALRIFQLPTAVDLPTDRESVFWLNVKDIPPEVGSAQSQLKIAYRSRLKFFYRPSNLRGDPFAALEQLTWSIESGGASTALRVHNASPYHITLSGVWFVPGEQSDGGMIAPFDSLRLSLPKGASAGDDISYAVVNDYGARVVLSGRVNAAP